MLTQVRKVLKGAAAAIIIPLLILAFMFFGVPEVSQFTGSSALTVGSEKFSQQYIQNEFTRAMQTQRQQTGTNYTREDAIAAGLHDQVVNQIATTSAIEQFSDDLGLALPREVLRDYIQSIEGFQNPATGQVDRRMLEDVLRNVGLSVTQFEQRIESDLIRSQLVGALAAAGPAPNPFVDAFLMRQSEQRRIAYLTVTNDMAGAAAEPTPDDLRTYYETNQTAFTAPEYRTFDMLVLRNSDFRDGLEAPEEELLRIYEINKPRLYDTPETRTIYQVTFDTEAEALAAVSTLRQGTPFETIAAGRGMSLEAATSTDAQKRDILDPAVAEAAFAEGLEEGYVVDPVEGIFGWTVLQIAGVTPPTTQTFEEVRDDIESEYLEQDTRRKLQDAIDIFEEERDTGADIVAAAEAIDRQVVSVGPVDRFSFEPGGAILSDIPGEVLAEAFLLEEGIEGEANTLSEGDGYYFVTVRDITAPAVKPYDVVADEVVDRWRKDEREQRISATVRSIREAVEGGQTLEEAAEPYARAPIEQLVNRQYEDDAISRAFNDQVFFAEPGNLVSGPTALGESQVVAEIREIYVSPRMTPPEQQNIYGQYLGYQLDQELLEAFVTEIREDYGVKVTQSQIEALFSDVQ